MLNKRDKKLARFLAELLPEDGDGHFMRVDFLRTTGSTNIGNLSIRLAHDSRIRTPEGCFTSSLANLVDVGLIETAGDGRNYWLLPGFHQAVANDFPRIPDFSVAQLNDLLIDLFSKDDIKGLCADMGINPEELPDKGVSGIAREFLQLVKHQRRLDELIEIIRAKRPNADLSGVE